MQSKSARPSHDPSALPLPCGLPGVLLMDDAKQREDPKSESRQNRITDRSN